jgi:hypothetical protein
MSNPSGPDKEVTPEALEVIRDINAETEKLRALDLADTPPAPAFSAG